MKKFPISTQHIKNHNTIYILAYITGVCNQQCKYCSFSSFKNSEFLDLNKLFNFLINLHNKTEKNIYIELIGGEPTLHKDILMFSNNILNYYPYIKIGIYSNFSLNYYLYDKLAINKVDLTLTWHSLQSDKYNNTFIQNVLKLLENNTNKNIDVHIMYEKNNIKESLNAYNIIVKKYPYNTELCLLDHNFKTNQIYFLNNEFYTTDDIKLYKEAIKQQKIIKDKIIYKVIFNDKQIKYLSVQDIYDKPEFYNFKLWQCDAGLNYMYINVNGDIYPCQTYVNELNNKIGNISDIQNINFKRTICKYDYCPCAWEAKKTKIFFNLN